MSGAESFDHSKLGVFILTHGRADGVITLRALRRSGYTGKVHIVIDDEDARVDRYRELYHGKDGCEVVQFCKRDVAASVDTCDTRPDRKAIVFARNACFDIAAEMGLDYHLQLDDDYQGLYRRRKEPGTHKLSAVLVRDLDAVFAAVLQLIDDTGATCVSFAQGGDLIGGVSEAKRALNYYKGLMRKSMNTLFFRRDRPVRHVGRFNEDASAYIVGGQRGELFFGYTGVSISPKLSQQSSGGMTDTYLGSGTYVKTMYSVMQAPSCVSVVMMGLVNKRYHHHVKWDLAAPKILNEKHRKERAA